MVFNELKQHGTSDFPFQLYQIDPSSRNYEMVFHWHTALEIIRVVSGSIVVTIDNVSYTLTPNEVFIVNSESVHSGKPQNCEYECVVFDINALKGLSKTNNSIIESLLDHTLYINSPIKANLILPIIDQIIDSLKNQPEGYKFYVLGYFNILIGKLQDLSLISSKLQNPAHNSDVKAYRFKKALNYITNHYNENITLEEISKEVGLSPKYFNKFFKDLTGETPFGYLISYRIEQSERMLINSDSSITKIAMDCGFSDASYYIRTFKKIKGKSPSKFRENYK